MCRLIGLKTFGFRISHFLVDPLPPLLECSTLVFVEVPAEALSVGIDLEAYADLEAL